jgi:hypothetical protein
MVDSEKGGKREQELALGNINDPREALTDENKALLAFFASEVARYLEISMGNRLEQLELEITEMGSRQADLDAAPAIREILNLFSKYKLFRILRALSRLATDDVEFTKNTLLRKAGVGQGFRTEGLNRLIEILCSRGLLTEVGRRGRGILYRATGPGARFFQAYVPEKDSLWEDGVWELDR